MPLEQSGSKEARSRNIKREIEAGKDPKQAEAIGYAVQRRNDESYHITEGRKAKAEGKDRTANPYPKGSDAARVWLEGYNRKDDEVGPHTTHAAGILFVTKEKRALFLKRGMGGDYPGAWCFPGGRQEEGESAEECAIREAEEEVGKIPSGELVKWTHSCVTYPPQPLPEVAPGSVQPIPTLPPATDFTTYKMQVDSEFVPAKKNVDEEHVGYAWAPIDQPPEPLHPGCRVALRRFSMTELDVAQAIRDGELSSPQHFHNVWLFNIRITGTGLAYRHKLKEFVWRDQSIYMNQRFLDRCNGLSVIFEHPKGKKAMLDTKEYNDRVVGAVFIPYLRPEEEEVWAIVKIYDEPTAVLMEDDQLSTSPAVVFTDPTVNSKVKLEDGNILLIEGEPQVLDHIAICQQGVWDKGGEPRGVDTAAIGDEAMVDKTAATTAARHDDDEDEKKDATLDKILSHVDAAISGLSAKMDARMDAIEGKMDKKKDDAEEEEEEGKAKAVVADKKRAKKDAKKDDDEDEKKDAEEEKAEKKEDDDDDSKKDSRKDAKARKDEPSEREEMAEKMKAKEKQKEGTKDDDDDAKKDARADSDVVTKADLEAIRRLIPKSLSDEEWSKFAKVQERADEVFSVFGDSAPRPLQGESLLGYRRRLLGKLQQHSARWKSSDVTKINDEPSFAVIEDQVYADAAAAALKPSDLKPGQFREVIKPDRTGRRISEFVGNGSFVRSFKRPGRRVARFGQNTYDPALQQQNR